MQDIAKCVIIGIGLFIGCIITGVQSAIAKDDLDEYCDGVFTPENNKICAQIEDIYGLALAVTVSYLLYFKTSIFLFFLQIINVVCMFLVLVLFVWDIIFLSANFKSKIPVPRVGYEVQQ